MAVSLPLFPLGTVLFPHMPLALHIFEERYRAMMRDVQNEGRSFGIVGIREGLETSGSARPYAVGTLAQLREVERLDDGRYDIVVSGASRFRVLGAQVGRPYLVAQVEYLEDHVGDREQVRRLVPAVRERFRRYGEQLRNAAGHEPTGIELPDDPELLSYLVAASMQVEGSRKQALLETDSVEERLRACLVLLRREEMLLSRQLTRRDLRITGLPVN